MTANIHKSRIQVKESDQRWYSDGFEFGCDDGEKLRVTCIEFSNKTLRGHLCLTPH